LQFGATEAAFRAWGGYPEYAFVSNTLQIVEVAAQFTVLLLGGYFLATIASSIVVCSLSAGLLTIYVRRRAPWLYAPGDASIRTAMKQLLLPSLSFLALPFGQAMQIQGFSIIVAQEFGPVGLVSFTAMRTLTRIVEMVLGLLYGFLQPEVSYVSEQADRSELKRLVLTSSAISVYIAISLTISLLLVGRPVFKIWTHSKIAFDSNVFGVFLMVAVFRSLSMPSAALLIGLNRHNLYAVINVIASLASLMLGAVVTATTHNIIAAAGATVVLELALIAYCVPAAARLLAVPTGQYLRQLLNPRLVADALRVALSASQLRWRNAGWL
jgi:O-antigen/teichoic acid export membrane protein